MKMNKKQIEELLKYIEDREWIVWSCGRSTDYVDTFWEEGSVENLVDKINKLAQ